jgi:hypothetical protein
VPLVFHRSPWLGTAIFLGAVLAVLAEGSYQESRALERDREGRLAALQNDHRAELAELRAKDQAAINAALTAAAVAQAGGSVVSGLIS